MNTKFILHGGFVPGIEQQDDRFFQAMLEGTPENVNILLVYFAEPTDKVHLRTEQDTQELNTNKGSKNLHLRVASETTFEADCAWADVIYLHGGKTVKLIDALSHYPNLHQMFLGKRIAGDSAGAHALGVLCYSKSSHMIRKGLGIIPANIAAHYDDGPNPFVGTESGVETVLLHEYETKVLYN